MGAAFFCFLRIAMEMGVCTKLVFIDVKLAKIDIL